MAQGMDGYTRGGCEWKRDSHLQFATFGGASTCGNGILKQSLNAALDLERLAEHSHSALGRLFLGRDFSKSHTPVRDSQLRPSGNRNVNGLPASGIASTGQEPAPAASVDATQK